jgi:hypothetical protein
MLHYRIMTFLKHLKMSTEDGLAERLCIVLNSCSFRAWGKFPCQAFAWGGQYD